MHQPFLFNDNIQTNILYIDVYNELSYKLCTSSLTVSDDYDKVFKISLPNLTDIVGIDRWYIMMMIMINLLISFYDHLILSS